MTRRRFRQDAKTGKMVEIISTPNAAHHHFVGSSFDGFVSPVDGSAISSRQQLTDHNSKHQVSNDLDHLREQAHRSIAPKKETRADVHERKLAIKDAIERVSSSGFHRRRQYEDAP